MCIFCVPLYTSTLLFKLGPHSCLEGQISCQHVLVQKISDGSCIHLPLMTSTVSLSRSVFQEWDLKKKKGFHVLIWKRTDILDIFSFPI